MRASQLTASVAIASPPLRTTPWAECISPRPGAASIAGRCGAAAAVCLGDHLLFAALALLAEVPEPALIRQFAGGLTQAVRGQASELDPGLWSAMTPARSLALARAKTGAM